MVTTTESLPYEWVYDANSHFPPNAVVGGRAPISGSPITFRELYVCRATYESGLHPGYLKEASCRIGWGGDEVTIPEYEVLVAPSPAAFTWVPAANGQVPPNAVAGGYERDRPLYVCRARYSGGIYPGKLVGTCCNIGCGGNEISISEYEVLVCPGGSNATTEDPPAFSVQIPGNTDQYMCLSLSATADTYIRADLDIRKNDNYGREAVFMVGTGRGSSIGPWGTADAMRSMIRFDLSHITFPVEKATLELTIHSFSGSTGAPFDVGVYRVMRPWQEGNGAEAYVNLLCDATSTDAAEGVAWAAIDTNNQAQPPFAPAPVARARIDGRTLRPGDVVTWDITHLVRRWVAMPDENFGLILRDLSGDGSFRALAFGSRESDLYPIPNRVRGPRLVIEKPRPLTALHPIGSTQFVVGTNAAIQWNADPMLVWGISVEQSTDGGRQWQGLTNSVVRPVDKRQWGNLNWPVPLATLGKQVQLRLVEYPGQDYVAAYADAPVTAITDITAWRERLTEMVETDVPTELLSEATYKWTVVTQPPGANPPNLQVKATLLFTTKKEWTVYTALGRTIGTHTEQSTRDETAGLGQGPTVKYVMPFNHQRSSAQGRVMFNGGSLARLFSAWFKRTIASGYYAVKETETLTGATLAFWLEGDAKPLRTYSYTVRDGTAKHPAPETPPPPRPQLVTEPAATSGVAQIEKGTYLKLSETMYDSYLTAYNEIYEFLSRTQRRDGSWNDSDWRREYKGMTSSTNICMNDLGVYQFKVNVTLWMGKTQQSDQTSDIVTVSVGQPPAPALPVPTLKANGCAESLTIAEFTPLRLEETRVSRWATDNGKTATYEFLERPSGASIWSQRQQGASNTYSTYPVDGSYEYKVKVTVDGKAYESSAVKVTVTNISSPKPTLQVIPATSAPNQPFDLRGENQSSATIKAYRFEIRAAGTASWSSPVFSSGVLATSFCHVSAGLAQAGEYEARVGMQDADGSWWDSSPVHIAIIAPWALSASVGANGANRQEDVRALRERLFELGFTWLTRDGTVDAELVAAIKLFQSIIAGNNTIVGDGVVDIAGPAYDWLRACNTPYWQPMPLGSRDDGFVKLIEAGDSHDYGTDWLANTIIAAGRAYHNTYLTTHPNAALLTVNDTSLPQGGDAPGHDGHETGMDCDIRIVKKNGTTGGITHEDNYYDQDAMREILKALHQQPLRKSIFFNDPVLIREGLCKRADNHDNHAHLNIKPPALERE